MEFRAQVVFDTTGMRKQAYIHLHDLLYHVADELDAETEEYRESYVKPSDIHRGKEDHREAVQKLAADIEKQIDEDDQFDESEAVSEIEGWLERD